MFKFYLRCRLSEMWKLDSELTMLKQLMNADAAMQLDYECSNAPGILGYMFIIHADSGL